MMALMRGRNSSLYPGPRATEAQPVLLAPLPDYLYWLTEKVEGLVRPAVFVTRGRDQSKHAKAAPLGATRCHGLPDIPAGAQWAPSSESAALELGGSPYDGRSFVFQLDLGEIPAHLRKEQWPAHGVVWVLVDLQDHWRAEVEFDPRPRESIVWRPRPPGFTPVAPQWTERQTIADGTPQTLPEIWETWRDVGGGLIGEYADWAQRHYGHRPSESLQIGGWVWPCQGDFDRRNEDFVCGCELLSFGDNSAVYLHFNSERGFYALVETH